mgnify:CR=1 FL=1
MIRKMILGALVLGFFATSCSNDDDTPQPTTAKLTLNLNGLEDLGSDFSYEGWVIVDGSPVSTGVFNVNTNGDFPQTEFDVDISNLNDATAYVLTIEPNPDSDPKPSAVHILAGDFSGDSASLTIDHPTAIGTDFTDATAIYVLRAPTDDGNATNNFEAGVWWFRNESGETLDCCTNLPELPEGWNYEGWAVVNGIPLSTGIFADGEVGGVERRDSYSDRDVTNNADPSLATGFNGNAVAGPNYPGEDFINNLPDGVDSPVDLKGKTIVVTVEPFPDTAPTPFTLKILVDIVPEDAGLEDFVMDNNAAATNPTGSASR